MLSCKLVTKSWNGVDENQYRAVTAHRIRYLDGLRGVAILIVVGWHYFGPTYAAKLPYGSSYYGLSVFEKGWAGVYLFFLISGFVIFRTLERSENLVEFLVKRWTRLAPALFAASMVIFAAAYFLPEMAGGRRHPIQLATALTFLSPAFFHALLRSDAPLVDGAYWTLTVEFAFYVVIGLLYFTLGWARALVGLVMIWVATLVLFFVKLPGLPRVAEPLLWAGFNHFGWFASGALFWKAHELRSNKVFVSAILTGLFAALCDIRLTKVPDQIALVLSIALFSVSQRSLSLQRTLANRALLFVGAISYPLYLLHNDFGVGMIARLGTLTGSRSALLALPVFISVMVLAWLLHRYVEPIGGSLQSLLLHRRRIRGPTDRLSAD